MKNTGKSSGISDAIDVAGSLGKLAREVGVSPQAVHKWHQRGFVPTGRLVAVEQATGIPRERLIDPRLTDLLDTSM